MWFSKNKSDAQAKLEVLIPEMVKEKPKETTRNAIMGLVFINNKTDKEYTFESENNFGLRVDYVGSPGETYKLILVKQLDDVTGIKWRSIGRLIDFSVIKSTWQVFDIVATDEDDENEDN